MIVDEIYTSSAQDIQDKRDGFVGALTELLISTTPRLKDVGGLEEVLLQVMIDEFKVVVDNEASRAPASFALMTVGSSDKLGQSHSK